MESLIKLIKEKNADMVIGIRTQKDSPDTLIKRKRFVRTLSAKMFNKIVNFLFKLDIKDTQCGFKLFDREKCKPIIENIKTDKFSFDVEILLNAKRKGFKIEQKQVVWRDSSHSSVRLFKDSVEMIKSLLKLKFRT